MKILSTILTLLLGTTAVFAVMMLPQPTGTNDLAAIRANQIREASQHYFISGRLAQLQKEMDTLQNEFLILAVLVGSTGAAICLLATRDQIRRAGQRSRKPCEGSALNK